MKRCETHFALTFGIGKGADFLFDRTQESLENICESSIVVHSCTLARLRKLVSKQIGFLPFFVFGNKRKIRNVRLIRPSLTKLHLLLTDLAL